MISERADNFTFHDLIILGDDWAVTVSDLDSNFVTNMFF
jgi:hypothetical protein